MPVCTPTAPLRPASLPPPGLELCAGSSPCRQRIQHGVPHSPVVCQSAGWCRWQCPCLCHQAAGGWSQPEGLWRPPPMSARWEKQQEVTILINEGHLFLKLILVVYNFFFVGGGGGGGKEHITKNLHWGIFCVPLQYIACDGGIHPAGPAGTWPADIPEWEKIHSHNYGEPPAFSNMSEPPEFLSQQMTILMEGGWGQGRERGVGVWACEVRTTQLLTLLSLALAMREEKSLTWPSVSGYWTRTPLKSFSERSSSLQSPSTTSIFNTLK